MEPTTKPTEVHAMACCSCKASFRQRVKGGGNWRQRSMKAPGTSEEVWTYLCPACAGRFSSEEAVNDYLDAELEQQIAARGKTATG